MVHKIIAIKYYLKFVKFHDNNNQNNIHRQKNPYHPQF